MSPRREFVCFAVALAGLVLGLLHDVLVGGKVLSPADILTVSASFRDVEGATDEPLNRLLIDPVLQFQPWLDLNREAFREGRLPLWNPYAGCGAPHLANAQSAPFDLFQPLGYLGRFPDALGLMSAGRLWVAGIGMFLLAGHWGLGPWGRWFAGLTFPLCGFLVVWLLFPVTNVAVWMPWVLLTGSRLIDRPGVRRVGLAALAVGVAFLGGHTQTTAHVLLAAGLFALWRIGREWRASPALAYRSGRSWLLGTTLGVGIGAVVTVPLGVYLTKSPVWSDRQRESPAVWEVARPRALDALCTAVPYLFGSHRRGHPHLAPALGVHNLNESAGGYVGLATLVWLVPASWGARRSKPVVRYLGALAAIGFLGSFGFPPVANLLRAFPVIDVIDARRMTLWVAFALTLLGGIGLDRLGESPDARPRRLGITLLASAGLMLMCLGPVVHGARPWLDDRARAHYADALSAEPGADPAVYRERALRQVAHTVTFLPRLFTLTGLGLIGLAGLGAALGRGLVNPINARGALAGVTLLELFGFAHGMNPAIDPVADRPVTPVVARLRERLGPGQRVIGVGQEFPPNVAMRYLLSDARNYDSVELSRSLEWFRPLYEPGPGSLSSRSTVTWEGVLRALPLLEASGVAAVVSASAPPEGLERPSERIGSAWVTWLDGSPVVTIEPEGAGRVSQMVHRPGRITVGVEAKSPGLLVVRETFDEGWSAHRDGRRVEVRPHHGVFMAIDVGPGAGPIELAYDPSEARVAVLISAACLAAALGACAAPEPPAAPQNPSGPLVGRNPAG